MKQLRVRLLILFTSTGTLMTAGYCDTREPEIYVLTENHLIMRPDQVEALPAEMVAESDELQPAAILEDALEPALTQVAATPERLEPPLAVPEEEAQEEVEEFPVVAWGPAKLGERRRLKTYLAVNEVVPPTVAALPLAQAPVPRPAAPKLTVPTRLPASVPRSTGPIYVAANRASSMAIGKAQPAPAECALEVESPNGGEELSQSVGERVLWKSSGVAGRVRIKLMKGEEDLGTLIVVQDDGATLIRIPDLVEPGPGYRLRIEAARDASCFDESDAEFSIRP